MQYKNKLNGDEELIIIPIVWEKIPFDTTTALGKKSDSGLYQIYGRHNAYGRDSLLYIGQAGVFSQRLLYEERFFKDFLETTAEPDSVRIGRIVKANSKKSETIPEENNPVWNDLINWAEKLLIATHTPAFNSQLDHKLYGILDNWINDKKHIVVLNFGDRGCLLPEVSTFRNSYAFYEYETPFGFEEEKK
ncbi:MAG: hypothetical protein M9904_05735 [Chitinophagaceae bacterium]|nr:hypothetical protein [Chitinophagaceae bacterium]